MSENMPAAMREALSGVRAQLERDHAEATARIEAGTATAWDTGRHYQAAQAAEYLAAAGLWDNPA